VRVVRYVRLEPWNAPPGTRSYGFPTRSRDLAGHWELGAWAVSPMLCPIAKCKGPFDVVTGIHLIIEFVQDFPGFFVCSAPAKLQIRVHHEYFYSNAKDNNVD
jgi:hypothetical protein